MKNLRSYCAAIIVGFVLACFTKYCLLTPPKKKIEAIPTTPPVGGGMIFMECSPIHLRWASDGHEEVFSGCDPCTRGCFEDTQATSAPGQGFDDTVRCFRTCQKHDR